MIEVKKYSVEEKDIWNQFNKDSKNSLFMFDRNYMDYHADRFTDHSLMFYSDDKLIALLPMTEKEGGLISHGGLTYGGFITDTKMKQHTMNECFESLIIHAKKNNFKTITYKCIPHVYHNQPAEEDRYSLFANGAKLSVVDASTYVNLKSPLKMPKGRKSQISRARREGVVIEELLSLKDYEDFIALENEVLNERHNTNAVHTGTELKFLHDYFPEGVRLYGAIKEGCLIAGTVVYVYDSTIHTQYMAANDEARSIGALDLTVSTVIETYKESKLWLDFGISTEHGRIYLNEGLISQKEGFGGRTGTYEIWEMNI